jgi:CRP-like cAMP-binding protein
MSITHKNLIRYFTKHIALSEDAQSILIQHSVLRKYSKGSILLAQGAIASESFLVLDGCVRSMVVDQGKEKTLDFFTECQPILPLSLGTKDASPHSLECLTPVVLCANTPEQERDMMIRYPCFQEICLTMGEILTNSVQKNLMDFKLLTPEARYLQLQKLHPSLLQRVPQYMVASYLGIEPQSLSRIRSRLAKSTTCSPKGTSINSFAIGKSSENRIAEANF